MWTRNTNIIYDCQWAMDAVIKFSFLTSEFFSSLIFFILLTRTKPCTDLFLKLRYSSEAHFDLNTWFFFSCLTFAAVQAWIDAFEENKEIRSRRFSEHLQFSPDMKHIQGFVAAIRWGRILTNHVEASWPCHVMWHSAPPRRPPGILSVVFWSSGAEHSDPEHSRTPALWQVPFHGTRPAGLWGGGRGYWPGSITSIPPVLHRSLSLQATILDWRWAETRLRSHSSRHQWWFLLLLALCGRSFREAVQVAAHALSSGLK